MRSTVEERVFWGKVCFLKTDEVAGKQAQGFSYWCSLNSVSFAHSAAAGEALSPAEPIGNQIIGVQLGTISYIFLRIYYNFLYMFYTFLYTS